MSLQTIERGYSVGRPMEMIMNQAPNAGVEAKRIWEKGLPASLPTLSVDRQIGVQEAIRNSFAFVQVTGRKAGKGASLASISTGLAWDRQSSMEGCAEDISTQIGGNESSVRWFGPHKLLVFVKGVTPPEVMLERLVDAPRQAYLDHLPNLAQAQGDLQDIRKKEILDGEQGAKFLQIFEGERDPMERAYQDDGKHSFVWGYQERDGQLWGVNLDNKPQAMNELAIDEETRQMLLAKEEFLTGDAGENRFVVEFDFSSTVSCCNISFNAQQDSSLQGSTDLTQETLEFLNSFEIGGKSSVNFVKSGGYDAGRVYCDKCNSKIDTEGKCGCGKD